MNRAIVLAVFAAFLSGATVALAQAPGAGVGLGVESTVPSADNFGGNASAGGPAAAVDPNPLTATYTPRPVYASPYEATGPVYPAPAYGYSAPAYGYNEPAPPRYVPSPPLRHYAVRHRHVQRCTCKRQAA